MLLTAIQHWSPRHLTLPPKVSSFMIPPASGSRPQPLSLLKQQAQNQRLAYKLADTELNDLIKLSTNSDFPTIVKFHFSLKPTKKTNLIMILLSYCKICISATLHKWFMTFLFKDMLCFYIRGWLQSCLTFAILECSFTSTKKNEAVLLQSNSFFQKNQISS